MKILMKWMAEHDLNLEQTSRLLGFSKSYLSLLMAGKRPVSLKVARAISNLTGESLGVVLEAA